MANNNLLIDEQGKIADNDPLNAILTELRYTNFLLETLVRGRTPGTYKNGDFRFSLTERDIGNTSRDTGVGILPNNQTFNRT